MARDPDQYSLDAVTNNNTSYAEDGANAILGQTITSFCFTGRAMWKSTGGEGICGNYSAASNEFLIRAQTGTLPNPVQMYRVDSTGTQTGAAVGGSQIAALSTWYHIGARWNGSNLRVWVDGSAGSTVSSTGSHSSATNKLRFSYGYSISQTSLRGHMQHCAVWVNGIPSDDVITAITSNLLHPLAAQPTHYYPLDHTSGTSCVDLTGGNPLTLGTGASFTTDETPFRFISLPIGPMVITREAAGAGVFNKTSSDAATFADTASETTTMGRAVSESLSLLDTASEATTMGRAVSESLSLLDTVSETTDFVATISEALSLLDTSAAEVGIFKTVSEALTLTDTASETSTLPRTVSEALSFTDTASETTILARTIAESLVFTDTSSGIIPTIDKTASDALTFTDTASVTAVLERALVESLNFIDTSSAEGGEVVVSTKGGQSLTLEQMRKLERAQLMEMLRQDDEVVLSLIAGILKNGRRIN